MLRIRNKGTVKKIKIPSDKLEAIQRILKSNVSDTVKENIIKHLSGGVCCICRTIPTQEVTYNLGNATRIERYCAACVKKLYEREQVLYINVHNLSRLPMLANYWKFVLFCH